VRKELSAVSSQLSDQDFYWKAEPEMLAEAFAES